MEILNVKYCIHRYLQQFPFPICACILYMHLEIKGMSYTLFPYIISDPGYIVSY